MSSNPRKTAIQIIYNVLKGNSNLSEELSYLRGENKSNDIDKRFVSELSTGVLRNLEYIDYAISLSSDIKVNKIAPYVMCVLRVGVYQLLFMDRVPDSAAINESVKIIKASSNRRLSGFVNALLRSVAAGGRDFPLPDEELARISTQYSCPQWMLKEWQNSGVGDIEKLASSMNEKTSTIIRTNTLKITPKELCALLLEEGWVCSQYHSPVFEDIDYLICAEKINDLTSSKAYRDGLFYVQDSAGAYVGHILNPRQNSVVFDVCASPGGKTTHLAQIMNNTGRIFAFDVSDYKIKKIKENCTRLGVTTIEAAIGDSSITNPKYHNTADYVLVDAPCSGLGIIRKKPDIKYLRKPGDSDALAKISLDILNACAPYLKSGGTMVFSTCTTVRRENEEVLFAFLDTHPEFHLKKIECLKENEGYITLFPHVDDCDGFFISLLVKD